MSTNVYEQSESEPKTREGRVRHTLESLRAQPKSIVALDERANGAVLTVRIMGKLTKADYASFVPEVEREISANGKVRMLVELIDFKGWTTGALWEDIKFDARHFADIDRLAIVGDSAWERGMAIFCKPFTTARIRYFDVDDMSLAKAWIYEGLNR